MIRIAALNDSDCESVNEEDVGPSEEALEADATRIYRKAIFHLAKNENQEALHYFMEVLRNPYTEKACWNEIVERPISLPQEIALKYSCLKNVGNLLMLENQYKEAFEYYKKAVQLDPSEVTLWYKLGASAVKIKDFQFAVIAFQEGLQVNPSHWPCLDQLLSVLFILGMYEDCLGLVITALKRDAGYTKGLTVKDKIFDLQPHLIPFVKEFFEDSDILFKECHYNKEKGEKLINSYFEMRPPSEEFVPPTKVPSQKLLKYPVKLHWVDLADSLIVTYEQLLKEEAKAFAGRIELENTLQDFMGTKYGTAENSKLNSLLKPGRRLNRSISLSDELIKGNPSTLVNDVDNPSIAFAPRAKVSSRRQTIELGERQDFFCVGTRRSLSIDLACSFGNTEQQEIVGQEIKNPVILEVNKELKRSIQIDDVVALVSTKEKISESCDKLLLHKENTNCLTLRGLDRKITYERKKDEAVDESSGKICITSANSAKLTDLDSERASDTLSSLEQSEHIVTVIKADGTAICSPKIISDVPVETHAKFGIDDGVVNDRKNDEIMMINEFQEGGHNKLVNESVRPSNEIKVIEKESDESESRINNFTEAAVNQFKDIMALKAPCEILGLPPPEFDFDDQEDQEFAEEYFDGGVYEDDEEDIHMTEAEKESDLVLIDDKVNNRKISLSNAEEENDSGSKDEVEASNSQNDKINVVQIESNLLAKEIAFPVNEGLLSENVSEVVLGKSGEIFVDTTAKKPKRMKRGLERELEQLDYWGRRKAREAKRRRKTLTSRLVGAFEENEYLTWAHLLRSFIPAALLSPDDSALSKGDAVQNINLPSENSDDLRRSLGKDILSQSSNKISTEINTEEISCSEQCWIKEQGISRIAKYGHSAFKEFSSKDYLSQWSSEELQVGEFLCKFQWNGGIIDIMQQCQVALMNKYKKVWPITSALAYKGIYSRVRKHILVGATLSQKEDRTRLYSFAKAALTNLELLVSLYRVADKTSFLKENAIICPDELFADDDLRLEDDIFHLSLLLGRPDVWRENYLQAHLRIQWVQFQIHMALGNPETAAAHLVMLIEEMEQSTREESEPLFINRCRVLDDEETITVSYLKTQLNVLQRSQMMEKVEEKFREGYYQEVVSILTSIFDKPCTKSGLEDSIPPRSSQLPILVESLVKTDNLLGILEWGAKALLEALENFKNIESETSEEKIRWNSTIESILASFANMFRNRLPLDQEPVQMKLPNFLSPLVDILVLQLEQSSGNSPCFNTLSPWLVTHYILAEHEMKSEENMEVEMEEDPSNEKSVEISSTYQEKEKVLSPFPSTLLLITAHEELGKNGWCCHEEGNLLIYMMDVLFTELNRTLSDEQRLLLHQSLEQVIFCLYSHPSRKTKVSVLLSSKHKHLRDHGVQPIILCWARALQIYKYYVPPQLPDFQSSQIPSISEDNVVFFKKVLSLMSNEYKHTNQIEHIDSFLNGDHLEFFEYTFAFPPELIDCYYLIADYYFKNKEWDLAIQYYKHDVSVNTNRIDSWAPMGLAKKAQLETLLNSCDVIENEENFFKEAKMAIKCLDRALYLDKYHTNMWVERGGLVYMIYSHSSRLLKQDLNPDLSIERFEFLEKIKEDMMQESIKCFQKTLQIVEQGLDDDTLPDERWLYRYMLGKLAEKSFKQPTEVLDHYLCAAKYLHDNGAKYPSKISYNNPQEYAVEAMEMYFRVHTYMFKYLHQREGKQIEPEVLKLFRETVEKISGSHFVKGTERKDAKSSAVAEGPAVTSNEVIDIPSVKPIIEGSETSTNYFIRNLIFEIIDKAVDIAQDKDFTCRKTSEKNKDDEILVIEEHIEEKDRNVIIMKCIEAWKLCITRFSHHYKSLYRISYYYHYSKFHKDNVKARNFLFGSEYWQRLGYMPSNGLFHERKTYLQNLKNCNLFHGVWRIPHDEIDRPGSFAAHMYRCVSLCLDILQDTKDFYTVLEVALSLKNSPDKDKKYLRDNERELLSEHSTQVGLQLMKDKFRILFKNALTSPPSPSRTNRRQTFLIDVHKAYKYMSRHLPCIEGPTSKMLVDSYAAFKNINVESNITLLREADNYCLRNSVAKRSLSQHIGYDGNMKAVPPSSHAPGSMKRGRPVGSGISREQMNVPAKFMVSSPNAGQPSPSAGQSVAVQQAYKVYENLIQAQTVLNSKNLDSKSNQYFQKKYEEYKQQMLKYLQIPSVSHFFHSSLQSLGTSAAKLPPPPPIQISNSETSVIKQDKHSLSSLAARSQAHGISISAVSKKSEILSSHSQNMKPNMSITLSPTKAANPSKSNLSISQPISNTTQSIACSKSSVTKTDTTIQSSSSLESSVNKLTSSNVTLTSSSYNAPHAKTVQMRSEISRLNMPKEISIVRKATSKSALPKLPAGTTLSRHCDGGPSKTSTTLSKVSSTCKAVEISKISGLLQNKSGSLCAGDSPSSTGISKTSITITPSNKNSFADKKQGPVSFQDAFQASLAAASPGLPLNSSSTISKNKMDKLNHVTQLSTAELVKLAFGQTSSSSEVKSVISKASSSISITKSSSSSSNAPTKVNKQLPDVIPLKLKDPLSTTNEEEEIITLD